MVTEVREVRRMPRRSEIPSEYCWDLTAVYADDAAWERAVAQLDSMAGEFAACPGTVGQGSAALLHALQLRDRAFLQLGHIYTYAKMRLDGDGGDAPAQGLMARAGSLYARLLAAFSFVEPEILALAPETLRAWQAEESGLVPYAYDLEQLLRRRPHVRSAESEEIIAHFVDIRRAAGETYHALIDVDMRFPTIEDEKGLPVEVSPARYGQLQSSVDRRVRRDAFVTFLSAYHGVRTTVAGTLATSVRADVLHARLHGYPTALQAALAETDIPVAAYDTLVTTVHANLPLLHRYMGMRRRLLGLDELHCYDLHAPLAPDARRVFEYGESVELARASLASLGSEYGAALEQVLGNRWIDVYPNAGKHGGAYSGGTYGTPPYILLNHQDRLRDLYTLVHELGHSVHSYRTRQAQPFITGNYTIFAAEVASTLNEVQLSTYLRGRWVAPALRMQVVAQQLEGIRTTLFRQTMFAEFELWLHTQVEAGEALTAEALCAAYRQIMGRYHGPELVLDEQIALEWACIPHFYHNYYVYQYATGLTAALALSTLIAREGEPAIQRYLRFLASGSSASAVDLLREAGVDMTTPAPIQQAMDHFETLMQELEELSALTRSV